jgi:hypothetical protein
MAIAATVAVFALTFLINATLLGLFRYHDKCSSSLKSIYQKARLPKSQPKHKMTKRLWLILLVNLLFNKLTFWKLTFWKLTFWKLTFRKLTFSPSIDCFYLFHIVQSSQGKSATSTFLQVSVVIYSNVK